MDPGFDAKLTLFDDSDNGAKSINHMHNYTPLAL